MSRWFNPPRGVFFVSAICLGLSFWKLNASSGEVAKATDGNGIPEGRCSEVWWLPASCSGIVQLQLAGSQAVAQTIVTGIQHRNAMSAAKTNVQLDYLLILSYVVCLGFFGATVAGMKGLQGSSWVRWVRRALLSVVLLQAAAGLLDGLENVGLFAMLQSCTVAPSVAEGPFRFPEVKWALIDLFAMLRTCTVAPGVAEWTFRFSAVKWALIDLGAGLPAVVLLVLGLVLMVRFLLSLLGIATPAAGAGPTPA